MNAERSANDGSAAAARSSSDHALSAGDSGMSCMKRMVAMRLSQLS